MPSAAHVLGVVAATLTAAGLVPGGAQAAGCAGLKGTRVLTTPSVKVASVKIKDGVRFVGCARPNGPLRVLGTRTRDIDDATTSVSVVKSAGTHLLVASGFDEGPAALSETRRYVVNLKTNRRRVLWRLPLAEGDCEDAPPDSANAPIGRPKQFVLGTNGVVAGVFVGGFCTQPGTRVVAFVPGKADRELDRGPNGTIAATSLRLKGRVVRWRRDGQGRKATV